MLDALHEVVDAAGGLEYTREVLQRVVRVAQAEFERSGLSGSPPRWAGANTPAVYYEFCNAVAWARAVDDRYRDQLLPVIRNDGSLLKRLQKIRSERAGKQLEDARELAGCGLHRLTPPYANAGATVQAGTLIYPVPDTIRGEGDFRANLRFAAGRHAGGLVDEYWQAVAAFIDGLLDVFYPPR